MYSLCSLLALAMGLWLAVRAKQGLLQPAVLWGAAWTVAALSYQGGLVRLYPLSFSEQFILGLGVLTMPVGCLVATALASSIPKSRQAAARTTLPAIALLGLFAIALGGFAFLLYTFSQKASLLLYLVAPERVEAIGFQVPVIGYLNLINIVLPAMLALQARRSKGSSWIWWLLAILSLLTNPFSGNKSYFMQAALGAAIAVLLDFARLDLRRLIGGGVLAVSLLIGFFAFYDYQMKEDSSELVEAGVVRVPPSMGFLGRPLLYVAGPSAAFGPFTRFEDDIYHGRATFRPLSKIVSRVEPLRLPPMNSSFLGIPMPFNTFTAFREPWEDARELGIVVYAFLLGFFAQCLWVVAGRRRSIPLLALCGFIGASVLFSPFVGYLVNPKSIFFCGLLILFHIAFGRAPARVGVQ